MLGIAIAGTLLCLHIPKVPAAGRAGKFNWNPFGDKVYKYKICVGPSPNPSTNCLDPDVDVWPF